MLTLVPLRQATNFASSRDAPYYADEDYPVGHGITEPLPERSK